MTKSLPFRVTGLLGFILCVCAPIAVRAQEGYLWFLANCDAAGRTLELPGNGTRCSNNQYLRSLPSGFYRSQDDFCGKTLIVDGKGAFDCISTSPTLTLSCVRSATLGLGQQIRQLHDAASSSPINAYLAAATKCPHAAGFTSIAPSSLLVDVPVGWFAKADILLGQDVILPSGRRGVLLHGYGSADPGSNYRGQGLEFIIAYEGYCSPSGCEAPASGLKNNLETVSENASWIVKEDPSIGEFKDQFEQQIETSGIDIDSEFHMYQYEPRMGEFASLDDLGRPGKFEVRRSESYRLIEREIEDRAASAIEYLRNEDFRRGESLDRRALQRVFDRQAEFVPFAIRDGMARRPSAQDIQGYSFLKERGLDCFPGEGVSIGLLYNQNSVIIFGFGIGSCEFDYDEYLEEVINNFF